MGAGRGDGGAAAAVARRSISIVGGCTVPEFDKKQHSEPHPFAVAPSDAKAAEKRADPALNLAQMP